MTTSTAPAALSVAEEVADALAAGRPVVAIESSGIVHGQPYPANLATALDVEAAIAESGALPARVGILDGRFVIGMSKDDVERFATDPDIPKVSTRDVALALAGGGLGAPTVSATLVAADLAGIRVTSVAGIGGVHYGAQQSFDISADLVQFSRSQVAVVCAGAKSVLDPALTLEYLETLGVPVVGYRCDDFPGYYSVSTGLPNPHRIDDLAGVAAAVRTHWDLGNRTGVLVTHPIDPADEIPGEQIREVIARSVAEAAAEGVTGPMVTPRVLSAVSAATQGRTGTANRSVLLSTSRLAGEFACALADEYRAAR